MSFGVVLAADGDVIWKREYDGNGPDYAMGVATDSYNNVIVTGYSFMGDNLDNLNYCTIKYDAAGNIIWKREYDGGDEDGAKGVATDSYNNVIVTGISEIGGRRSDYCTIKYQGVPPRSKSLPIDKFLKILKRNRCKNHPDAEDCKV